MYGIDYKYTLGTIVWTKINNDVVECIVQRLIIEIDPVNSEEIRTYHLDPVYDMDYGVLLRREYEVFDNPSDALAHDPELTPTITPTVTVTPTITPTPSG